MRPSIITILILGILSCTEDPVLTEESISNRIDVEAIFAKHDVYEWVKERDLSIHPDTLKAILEYHQAADTITLITSFIYGKVLYNWGKWQNSTNHFKKTRDLALVFYPDSDNLHADIYSWWALPYFKLDKCDSLGILSMKAVEIIERTPEKHPPFFVARAYRTVGQYYGCVQDHELMLENYHKSYSALDNVNEEEQGERAWYLARLAYAYLVAKDYWTSIEYSKQALPILINFFGHDLLQGYTSSVYDNLGECYNAIGEYDKAIFNIQKALDHNLRFVTVENCHQGVASNYKNLAIAHEAIGDLERAKIQYDLALQILERLEIDNTVRAGLIRIGLVGVLFKSGELKAAEELILKALELEQTADRSKSGQTSGVLYQWLGKVYLKAGKKVEAKAVFDQASDIYKSPGLKGSRYQWDHLLETGKAYIQAEFYQEGLNHLLALYKKIVNTQYPGKAELALQISKCYNAMEQFQKAKEWLNISANFLGYKRNDSKRLERAFDAVFIADFLGEHAKWHEQKYKSNNKNEALDMAIFYLEDATNYLFKQRNLLQNSTFINQVFSALQERLINLYQEKNSDQKLSDIFRQFEQSKGVKLVSIAKAAKAKDFAGVPKEIIEEFNTLEKQVNFYKTELQTSDENINYYRPKLVEALSDLRDLKKITQKDYPDFFQYRVVHQTIKVSTMQKRLSDEEVIIEYFWGDQSVKAIFIRKDTILLEDLGSSPHIKEQIELLLKAIEDSRLSNVRSIELMQSYINSAHELYELLILPFAPFSSARLRVIPDGPLNTLPFSSLLKSKPEDIRQQYNYNYLVNDFAISLGYSATFQFDFNESIQRDSLIPYIGFAPYSKVKQTTVNYKSLATRDNYDGLYYSQKEVESGKAIFGGKYYLDTTANKSNFLTEVENAKIVHCATHGVSNEQNGGRSYMLFASSQGAEASDLLWAQEVYNLELNSVLTVLGACQSAQGEFSEGEGTISLAYAFSAAGSSSVCSTYWNLNDKASHEILTLFFKALKELNLPKDVALQYAQKKYIEIYPERAHPFYWAVFNLYGDTQPLQIN